MIVECETRRWKRKKYTDTLRILIGDNAMVMEKWKSDDT